ncbi:MAG: hypothetical protein CV087_20540 [Candidatus Brocadia sp. WS118]|nr:MAG: hypothetical protein CV087_20540 [Candidatus Brocadia sp. WS118]
MTYWTDKDKEWIYWEGYWGEQTKSKMNGKEDYGLSGPQSPPHIDYINEVKEGEKSEEGRWHKPLKWADAPLPSKYYEVCNSENSKVVTNYLESNSGKFSDYCNWTSDLFSCDDVCSNLRIIYSEEDLVFDVYSLDGKEVNLKISRHTRKGEIYEVEFNSLAIPRNGKASLTFSPEQNPSLEIGIDHDMDGYFDSHRLPDYFEIK